MHHVLIKILGGIASIVLFGNVIYELHFGRLIEGPAPQTALVPEAPVTKAPVPERRTVLPICFSDDRQTYNPIGGNFLLEDKDTLNQKVNGSSPKTFPDQSYQQPTFTKSLRNIQTSFEEHVSSNLKIYGILVSVALAMISLLRKVILVWKAKLCISKRSHKGPLTRHVAKIKHRRANEVHAKLVTEIAERSQQPKITVGQNELSNEGDGNGEDVEPTVKISESSSNGKQALVQGKIKSAVEVLRKHIKLAKEEVPCLFDNDSELNAVDESLHTLKKITLEIGAIQSLLSRDLDNFTQDAKVKLREINDSKLSAAAKIRDLDDLNNRTGAKVEEYNQNTERMFEGYDELEELVLSRARKLIESAKSTKSSTKAINTHHLTPSQPSNTSNDPSPLANQSTNDTSLSEPASPTASECSSDSPDSTRPDPSPLLSHEFFQPEDQPLLEHLKSRAQKRSHQAANHDNNYDTLAPKRRSGKPQDPAIEPPWSVQEYVSEWHHQVAPLKRD